MIGRKNRILFIIVAIVVAVSAVGAIFYLYKNKKSVNAPLTNAQEVVLQQQIARIIASKKIADCATISNTTYRKACEQALSPQPQGKGTSLQTTSAEPMTAAQLQTLVKSSSFQPRYPVTAATTTP